LRYSYVSFTKCIGALSKCRNRDEELSPFLSQLPDELLQGLENANGVHCLPCKDTVAQDDQPGVEEGYHHELYSSGMDFGLHRPWHSLL
jgi:hypothetical protein